jgi:hypothetical protein
MVSSLTRPALFIFPSPLLAYEERTSTIGYITLSGSTSSNLAKLLEPPSLPPKPKGYGYWWILIVYPVIPVVGAIFSVPFVIPGLIVANVFENVPFLTGIGIVLICIGMIIGFWLAIRLFVKRDKKKKAIMEQKLNEAKPNWEIAMQRWKRIYYCHRDGIVFDPESGDSCPPTSVRELLYKQF